MSGPPPSPLPLDSESMWEATMGLPEQASDARRRASAAVEEAQVDRWGPFTSVAVLGMGGSGMAGLVAQAVAGPRLGVPLAVVNSYALPAFVGPGTLVFAVSCSGETEETLAATSAAFEAGAEVVAVASGGTLAEMAADRGAPVVTVPADLPQPRTALGAMAVPPLVFLQALGLLAPSEDLLGPALDQLAHRRDQLAGDRTAEDLARRLGRTVPLLHGGSGSGAVAAWRWKTQVNENAKAPAFCASQPELCHNELAGWGQHGDVTRQLLTLVQLRCPSDHPRVARRFALVADMVREVVAEVIEVQAAGGNDLAELFDLILLGDVVSLRLAGNEGLDPGPVPALAEVKAALAAGSDPGGGG